jgi:hypothetical protein
MSTSVHEESYRVDEGLVHGMSTAELVNLIVRTYYVNTPAKVARDHGPW